MNAMPVHARQRARFLRALGVTPWRRRHATAVAAGAAAPDATHAAVCAVVLPKGSTTRELDLLGRALYAFGPQLARAARIEAVEGELSDLPAVQAYLIFGEPQARALGRGLSGETRRAAHMVLADTPAQLLSDAAAKRRLWHALRGLRRALAAAVD